MSKAKFNPFDIEHQYQFYLAKVKLKESEMHAQQKIQLRRAFYAAAGQMLLVLRDDLTSLPENIIDKTFEDMLQQCHLFWNTEAINEQKKE